MEYIFDDLLVSVTQRIEPRAWEETALMVAHEREKVEAFVGDGGQAYGFTTLFGHLDSIQREREGRENLYSGHMVGHPGVIRSDDARGILTIKLCQISQGGTGISSESFARLREVFASDLRYIRMDLQASYGSGDVVPASWLVHSIFPGPDVLKQGDLMAMINGAFIPAGLLLSRFRPIEQALRRAQELIVQARDLTVDQSLSENVQLPVSLRDPEPLENAIGAALERVKTAVTRAANRKSGNPLFHFGARGTYPVSNSSFLDFQLSLDVGAIHETVRIAGAYVVAATRWVCGLAELIVDELEGPLFVQLPKVCKAYEDDLSSSPLSAKFSQVESKGVEDISDSSLRRVLELENAVATLELMSDLLANALGKLHGR